MTKGTKHATSTAEARLRARICLLVERAAMLKGSLSVRATVCGKPSCRCARGEKHRSVCLVAYDRGGIRQQHVPHARVKEVRGWIATWREVVALLEQISRRQWRSLKSR
jgi:hypothetical protein